jgi:teichuronic acid biosynthesis glycosyltransferase TuaH
MLNFVIFSLSRWNEDFGTNIRDISYELAKHHRVLFIDVPLKRKDRWLDKKSERVKEVDARAKNKTNLVKVSENLWHYIDFVVLESVNSIQNNTLFDIVNRVNNRRFAKAITKAIQKVNFNNYILLNDNDIYNGLYLKIFLKPTLYIYYLRDRLQAMSYWKKQVTRLEPQLLREVDLVLTNSVYLADSAKAINPNSFYIGQGCDVNHFSIQPALSEIEAVIPEVKKPIVGYIGALNSERLDIGLLVELATRLHDYSFVLVGKEDTAFKESNLHNLTNVFFTGNQDFSQLTKYLYSFSVAINPQLLNDITIGNYPRKIDEFLAAGIPVIATETPTMLPFSNHVYLGKTVDDYVTLIRQAIYEDNHDKRLARKEFASNHNWKNSVGLLLQYTFSSLKSTVSDDAHE